MSTFLKLLGAMTKPVIWVWRKFFQPDLSPRALSIYTDTLADRIRDTEESQLTQLRGGLLMDVEFRAAPRLRSAAGTDIGTIRAVEPYFQRLDTPQRLVLLGQPGAGKTVMAVHLALDLLETR